MEDIAFRILAAGNQPNFRTISGFRKIHLQALAGMFEQVLKIALQAGSIKLGRVALDGTTAISTGPWTPRKESCPQRSPASASIENCIRVSKPSRRHNCAFEICSP